MQLKHSNHPGPGDQVQPPITVMAVDDHPIFLEGIASILDSDAGVRLVAQALDGNAALVRYRELRPDVTLMDIQMPGMDGIAATRAIRAEFPEARIVMLTTYEGDGYVLAAIEAGAFAYILKSSLRSDLLALVRSVHQGYRSRALNVTHELQHCLTSERLTARELDVLCLVAQGQSNKRVGVLLGISEETVKTHMKNILMKLGASDRAHAVALALGRGLLASHGQS